MAVDVGSAVGYLDLDTSGFRRGFKSALDDLKSFGDKTKSLGDRITSLGSSFQSVGSSMTKYLTTPIAGAGTAFATISSKFESSMSEVQAISGATGKDFEDLTNKAKEMGAKTKFSASEAAEAMKYMAMAGWKTEDMLSGIGGIMDLAAASDEDLATTSDIVTDALTAFGLTAKDSAHFADILASASNNANTNVSMLGESFKYVAPVAGALGYSAEDTSIALGLMANAGIKSSQAGTELRTSIANLVKPTDDMAVAMDEYGISLKDSEGNMKPLLTVMDDLRSNLGGLDEATQAQVSSTLFGKEAMSGMLAIINASDEDYAKLTEAIYGADGASAKMADTMQNNLKGQLTILKSTLEGIAISFGDLLLPTIKKVVAKLQELSNWINNLSEDQKRTIVKIGAVIAAIGPALIILGKVISTIGKLHQGLKTIKNGLKIIKGAFASISAPVVILIGVIGTLIAAFKHLWDTNSEFRDSILTTWGEIKDTVSGFIEGLKERFDSLGIDFQSIADTLSVIWEEFCNFLAPIFEGTFETIASILGTVLDSLLNIFDIFIDVFNGDWESAWEDTKGLFQGIWEGIVDAFNTITDTLKNAADVFLGWFGTSWDQLWVDVGNFFSETWDSIVQFFQDTVDNITTGVSNFIDDVVEFFANLPETLAYWLGYALGAVVTWIQHLAEEAPRVAHEFIDHVVQFFSELPGKIWEFLTSAFEKIKTWGVNTGNKARDIGSKFLKNISDKLRELPGKFKEWFTNVMDYLAGLPERFIQKGKDIMNGLWDGLKSVWENVSSWFSGVWDRLTGMKDSLNEGIQAGKDAVEGSFASGIDYIPRDMIVRVHEGESIRTKQQTRGDLDRGSGGDTYNFYSPKPIDAFEAARQMKIARRELAEGF